MVFLAIRANSCYCVLIFIVGWFTVKRVFFILLVLLLFIPAALAHPGGTDSKGGHTNRKTGEYHFHHGHPEHQHPGGICPYGDYEEWLGGTRKSYSAAAPVSYATVRPSQTQSYYRASATQKPELEGTGGVNPALLGIGGAAGGAAALAVVQKIMKSKKS